MADKPLPNVNQQDPARAVIQVKLDSGQFKVLDRMVLLLTNVSDNLYNLTGFMGAQLTSLKETEAALKEMAAVDEGKEREKALEKERKQVPQQEKKNPFQKIIDFFDNIINVLLPFIIGFFIGLKKEIGLIAALALVFRKQIFSIFKLVFDQIKKVVLARSGTAATDKAAGAAGAAGQQVPESPEGKGAKGAKKGPSGLDKFLEGARKTGKAIKDLFVGIADTIAKVLGKLAGGIKDFISKVSQGIKTLLQNIAKGIESFGKGNVLKGAAALLVVSGALFVAAKAFKEFADVKWESVAKGLVGITGLVVVMKLLEKVTGSIIKGAAALAIMSGALFIAGKAFQQFADVNWETLAIAAVGIGGLAAAMMLLGPAIVPITLGAAALGVMSLALAGFGAAVQVLAAGLPTISEFIKTLATIDGGALLLAASGITAIGVALAALGAGQVIQALGNFVSGILSFGEEDIFTKLTNLGKVAGDLNQLPATLEALGGLSNFKVSSDFMKNVDILSGGLKKIADAAKGFENTDDSLTALAKIAGAMGKPAGGAAGKPAATGGPMYSEKDLADQKKRLEIAEKAGGKAAISVERSRLQNMESRNRLAAAEGPNVKPVPTGVPGQTLNAESQAINNRATAGQGAGVSQNVVAPTTTVNQSSSQNLSTYPSATPAFGSWQSQFYNLGLSGRRPEF